MRTIEKDCNNKLRRNEDGFEQGRLRRIVLVKLEFRISFSRCVVFERVPFNSSFPFFLFFLIALFRCLNYLFLVLFFQKESMKNLRDSLPSWIDSDRAGAVGSLKVCSLIFLSSNLQP